MVLAVVLVLIAVGAVVFQLWSPWWLTPLASNWKLMDDTLWITLVICGVVFVAINVFGAVNLAVAAAVLTVTAVSVYSTMYVLTAPAPAGSPVPRTLPVEKWVDSVARTL